jgi:hypothetical protein
LTSTRFEQIDAEILHLVGSLLDANRARLELRGINIDPPEIEVAQVEPSRYTSEVRVYFLRKGDVLDVLEFHVFRQGKQLVTAADIASWLPGQIESVLVSVDDNPTRES